MVKRRMTRKEMETRIVETLADIGLQIGLGKLKEVKKQFQKLCANSAEYKPKTAVPAILAHMFYDVFGQTLKKRLTEQNLERILTDLKHSAPQLSTVLRRGMKEMQKTLRRRGGPGRQHALELIADRRAAVQQVSNFYSQGKTLPQAFEETAKIFQALSKPVSARTIKTYWQKRKELHGLEI